MERRPTSKYPLHIYMRNESTSMEITGDDGLITLESRTMLKAVPPEIDTWGCKYRKMSDGRCFVVMNTFIPVSFLYDLCYGESNKEAKEDLSQFLAESFHKVIKERKKEQN